MLELFVNNTSYNMQNVYTPLPFNMHFVFCLAATLIYLLQYYRKRSLYYIFIMIAIDLTFVTQYYTNKTVISILFFAEIILLVLAVIFAHRYNKKIKAEKNMSLNKEKESAEKQNVEKSFSENEKKIVDNAFEDIEDL